MRHITSQTYSIFTAYPSKEARREEELVQLQPGMSLNQFLAISGEELQCEVALEDARWPEGFAVQSATVSNTIDTEETA